MAENEGIEKILNEYESPLMLFSLYTGLQTRILLELGQNILRVLDAGISDNRIDGNVIQETYGMFWLWVLGVYEVVRTMSQHSECFAEPIKSEIGTVKKTLHKIRIPFAKQEMPGRKGSNVRYVYGELSVSGIDTQKKDFMFKIQGDTVSMRTSVADFEQFIKSIDCHHIVKNFPLGEPETIDN